MRIAHIMVTAMSFILYCSAAPSDAQEAIAKPAIEDSRAALPVLDSGAFGGLVESLQRTLNDRINSNLSIDGDFGQATQSAVKAFQARLDLAETGSVDAATWTALGELITESPPVPTPEVVNARSLPRTAALDPNGRPAVSAKAWAVLDTYSGSVLHSENGDEHLAIASTTKLMTAYLVLELAQKTPNILGETVTFSERADNTVGSTAGVRAGEMVTVEELLFGLLLPSGNDASVAFAEHFGARLANGNSDVEISLDLAKSYDQFISAMNGAAKRLGLTNTHFANPHGLTEAKHYSSANDLAKLANLALRLPALSKYVSTRLRGCRLRRSDGSIRDVVWTNTNRLLSQTGFTGVKTGTTTAAGACLIACGKHEDRERIIVVLGSSSSEARYIDARNLFAWSWRTP